MKLYFLPGACSLASHIIGCELDLDIEYIKVDISEKGKFAGGQNYFEINPKGTVPALLLDNGEVLTENAVVLQYLASLAPGSRVSPDGGMGQWRTREMLNYVATEIHKGISPLVKPIPDEAKAYFKEVLLGRYAYLDKILSQQPYLTGEDFGLPDAYLFVFLYAAKMINMDLSSCPALLEYTARLRARPSIRKALEQESLPLD